MIKLDNLELCSSCRQKVSELESNEPFDIKKEQKAGGLKDEL